MIRKIRHKSTAPRTRLVMKAALSIILFFQIPAQTLKPGTIAKFSVVSASGKPGHMSVSDAAHKQLSCHFIADADSGK